MSLRPFAPLAALAIALAALACQPSIPNTPPTDATEAVPFAVSFPSASDGTASLSPPTPNDLVLQAATCSSSTPGCTPLTTAQASAAQIALLKAFAASGGFSNDQEVPIRIQFFAEKIDPKGGAPTPAPVPELDTTTITPRTLAVVRYDTATPTPMEFEVAPTDFDAATGVLTIHKKTDPVTGARWWPTGPGGGRYVVALRGGDGGVKTKTGRPIAAQIAALLISQDADLTKPENQGLLKTQPNPAAVAAQLEALRQLYATPKAWTNSPTLGWVPALGPAGLPAALSAIDVVFPHRELASLQTFVVDPSPHVAFDAAAGALPLPSEFLMTSGYYTSATGGTVQEVEAFGSAAAGLATLDGFSTTAMILAPTTSPVVASTVTNQTVALLELQSGNWVKLSDVAASPTAARYVTEPPSITVTVNGTAIANTIGLQPAVPVGVDAQAHPVSNPSAAAAFLTIPPLRGATRYAVVITNGVKDANGQGLAPGTIAKILQIALDPATPIVDGSGISQLSGVSNENAQQLAALAPAVQAERTTGLGFQPPLTDAFTAASIDPTTVAFAYTFRTQTLSTTLSLATIAANLGGACGAPCSGPVVSPTVSSSADQIAAVFAKYGIDVDGSSPVKSASIGAIVETKFFTFDLLDPATGAFRADLPQIQTNPAVGQDILTNHLVPIDLLLVLPATPAATPTPVVVLHHGLGGPNRIDGSRAYALTVASNFAAQGLAVAAIDMAKHGDRSFCNVSAVAGSPDAECAPDSTCVAGTAAPSDPAGKGPGRCMLRSDTSQPGHFQNRPAFCLSAGTCGAALTANRGIPLASGEFFITSNLFRARDTIRQDVVDHAQLVRVLRGGAFSGITAGSTVTWAGQSLGAITGVLNVAANTAFERLGINGVGGTVVDSLANSIDPTIQAGIDAIFLAAGIDRNVVRNPTAPGSAGFEAFEAQASAYLKALSIFKWILDPAEPLNYAATPGLGAKTLGQLAMCDDTFPNAFGAELYGNMGLQTVPASPPFPVITQAVPATAAVQWFIEPAASATACPAGRTNHGFFLNWGFRGTGPSGQFLAAPEADQAALGALTQKAQASMADFLRTGALQATGVTPTSTP